MKKTGWNHHHVVRRKKYANEEDKTFTRGNSSKIMIYVIAPKFKSIIFILISKKIEIINANEINFRRVLSWNYLIT
jgi:hypothetical protein